MPSTSLVLHSLTLSSLIRHQRSAFRFFRRNMDLSTVEDLGVGGTTSGGSWREGAGEAVVEVLFVGCSLAEEEDDAGTDVDVRAGFAVDSGEETRGNEVDDMDDESELLLLLLSSDGVIFGRPSSADSSGDF